MHLTEDGATQTLKFHWLKLGTISSAGHDREEMLQRPDSPRDRNPGSRLKCSASSSVKFQAQRLCPLFISKIKSSTVAHTSMRAMPMSVLVQNDHNAFCLMTEIVSNEFRRSEMVGTKDDCNLLEYSLLYLAKGS